MRYFVNLCFLSLTLLLSACDEKSLSLIPSQGVILAFGDSLTLGKGVSKNNSYPAILSKLTHHKVINAGVSGETTQEGLSRLNGILEKYQPALMILLEGGNDILRSANLNKSKDNLSKMIQLAHFKNIQVVLLGVPKRGIFLRTANFYQQLADEHQLVFAKDLVTDLLSNQKYKSDLIHFNQLGYQTMAQKIYQLLLDKGALE